MTRTLEICVDSITSAIEAYHGGAMRLELCQELSVGGLTPSSGLIKVVKKFAPVPVHMLIRPRSGDFHYNLNEVWQMLEDVKTAINLGMNGIVIGALDGHRQVDREVCARLIANAFGLPVTFHRAFDLVADPERALEDIIQLGFSRILTSGQKETAYIGRDNIRELVEQAGSRIIIMPGCGITLTNLLAIAQSTKAKEFHSSARILVPSLYPPEVAVVEGTGHKSITSANMVRDMIAILKRIDATAVEET